VFQALGSPLVAPSSNHNNFQSLKFAVDPQLNLAQQQQDDNDKNYQTYPAGGSISPRPAMRPDRDYSYKHQYQDYD
jgi:hypothetical protein